MNTDNRTFQELQALVAELSREPMFVAGLMLLLFGLLVFSIAHVGLIVTAMKRSTLWGLGVMLLPPVIVAHVITDWARNVMWTVLLVVSLLVGGVGFWLVYEAMNTVTIS